MPKFKRIMTNYLKIRKHFPFSTDNLTVSKSYPIINFGIGENKMGTNINIDVKIFEQRTNLDNFTGYTPSNPGVNPGDQVDAMLAQLLLQSPPTTNSNTNGAFANINGLFANPQQAQLAQQPVENYGGFKFKNDKEQAAVDQALQELRAQQAANPGQKVSKKIKVGKYKLTINLNEDGSVNIKRKKKGGFFSKIGDALKGVGKILKKALPIISTVAMFIPGLQPLALAGRIASGVMGVVDGIKNGNVFGALTSAVGAFSGIGGKVGSFVSGLGSKASGLLNSVGGAGSNWFSNAFNTVSNVVSKGKDMWSNFTGGIGTRVSDFLFKNGSNVVGDLAKSFGGGVGNWLSQNGSNLVRSFADRMGNRAVSWLNDKASNVLNRVMNNPLGQRIGNFFNSGFGQMLLNFFRGRQT